MSLPTPADWDYWDSPVEGRVYELIKLITVPKRDADSDAVTFTHALSWGVDPDTLNCRFDLLCSESLEDDPRFARFGRYGIYWPRHELHRHVKLDRHVSQDEHDADILNTALADAARAGKRAKS